MSELKLPEPAGWATTGRLPRWALVGAFAVLTYVVVRAVLSATRGNYGTTIALLGIFTFPVIFIVILGLAASGRVTARTSTDATGFSIWPDGHMAVLYFVGLAVLAPSALLFAILLPRGMIDLPFSRGMQIFYTPAAYALCFIALSGLIAGVRRGGVGYLKFTPAMIEIADVLRTRILEWDDVVEVRDHASTKKANRAGRSVVLHLRNGDEAVIGNANVYVPGGAVLYWMVRHYWKHPEDRDELVDERALQRFEQRIYDVS